MTDDQWQTTTFLLTNFAFIALGSNKGNRLSNLQTAVKEISDKPSCTVEKVSSIYETKPYGEINQDNFLNAVIKIKTGLTLLELFHFLKNIEKKLGRTRTVKWGPREIDLDLLFYSDVIYSDDNLTVPHKGIPFRDFVLTPMCEIEPQLKHPELNKIIYDICKQDYEKNIIRKLDVKLI